MTSITPSTIQAKFGSTYFSDNTKLMVSYLDGKDTTKPSERINGLSSPCGVTISVLDMRTYPDKDYWIIAGRIVSMDCEDDELLNTVQTFYHPRDSFMLPNVAPIP
jgi:hypothetical protein